MELFKLNSTFYPSTSIVDFDTLIWTERYQREGDFKLVVEDNINILTLLPKGSLISHNATLDVMIVEDHEIKRDKNKKLTVTLTGRSFETFAENRTTAGSATALYNAGTGGAVNSETITASVEDAVLTILEGALDGVTAILVDDRVANLNIRQVLRAEESSATHIIQRGDAYSRSMELLKIGQAGLKTERPNGAQTTIDLVIHDGVDRSATVIFYSQKEDLEDATYFSSIRNYKTHARVTSHGASRLYRHKDLSEQTGLNRRTIYVEANDIEGTFGAPSNTDAVGTRGQRVLDDHRAINIMQAKISPNARPRYKIHYNIGDLVKVHGEFSTVQTMQVTEHILTIDDQGVKGYPSLAIV